MISANAGTWVNHDGCRSVPSGSKWDVGNSQPLWMRHERVEMVGGSCGVRLLYASDLHLGVRCSGRLVRELVRAATLGSPNSILLGGDLVDSWPGFRLLEFCVRSLSEVAPVCAVSGNHDRVVGVGRVRRAVEAGGGRWLLDQPFELPIAGGRTAQIDGELQPARPSGVLRILCAHDPAVFPSAAREGYRLVLAGHLHGSQCVLAERGGMLYPGAWFFRWNGLRFSHNGCLMLVSRGVADTIPLRWNCPREVLLCEL